MRVGAVVMLAVMVLPACAMPLNDPVAQMPITVESALFPDVAIECSGERLSEDECLKWAEEMLPAAPTRPSGGEGLAVAKLVLTNRTGNSRCAADYFAADGRLVMTAAARCPSL